MVDIKTRSLNGNGHQPPPVRGFVDQAAEVAGNVIELAELQIQLAKEDAKSAVNNCIGLLITLAVSGLLLIATLPLLFFGLAGWLAQATELSLFIAQIIVGGGVALIAILMAAIAGRSLKNSLSPFRRSAAELNSNIAWLKTIFQASKT